MRYHHLCHGRLWQSGKRKRKNKIDICRKRMDHGRKRKTSHGSTCSVLLSLLDLRPLYMALSPTGFLTLTIHDLFSSRYDPITYLPPPGGVDELGTDVPWTSYDTSIFHFPFSMFHFPFYIFHVSFSIFHFPFSIFCLYTQHQHQHQTGLEEQDSRRARQHDSRKASSIGHQAPGPGPGPCHVQRHLVRSVIPDILSLQPG